MDWLGQRWKAFWARRSVRCALLALGESLPPSAEVAAFEGALWSLAGELAASLERDRAEYAAVRAWARPLVVLRGVLDRAVLRERRGRLLAERRAACVLLGATSLPVARGPLADLSRRATAASAEAAAQVPPLPRALVEVGHFVRVLLREARGQLLPRLPAVVGLGVGWWIAQTFTDSEFSATLHSWGIGSGPRLAVRSETLRAMSFWMPLLAAASCSYAGSRLATLLKARYSPPEAAERQQQPR
jgi:hypothetical protein